MRKFSSPGAGKSLIRLCAAVLLASAATGCSSGVSRFDGLFSSSDGMTTGSIPQNTMPVPRGDVAGAQRAALGHGYPDAGGGVSYDQMNAASAPVSSARAASTPMNVQRTALAEPAPAAPRQAPAASRQPQPALAKAEPLSASARENPGKGGWSAENAPTIMVRQGDTVAVLSRRFGVPEKEILKANGLRSADQVEPGQRLVIPTFGTASSAAKAAASSSIADLDGGERQPLPLPAGQREVAILPGQSQSREKNESRSDVAASKTNTAGEGAGGFYTVKAGDSLNRIAKANGVSVGALKQANGLTTESIRIGQKLTLPGGAAVASDAAVTASVPSNKTETKVASLEKGKPAEYKPPVAKESVSEVAIRSDVEESPKSTGISKYRWPVRGAVVAAYGANVDGNRNDGINISVPEGTPIKAAENGVVIYSGSSLKELGNAVLVRHDDGTVTVYGNASELNVQRGQKVQRGQTLASSGMTGRASRPQVHFEVRKNATPVNPATYLE
jgi:murein DD-endopeptidase MepM/ murein hydrolase activator NlpD